MALKLLTCMCHGAEPMVRGLLQECKVPNWMDYPIHMGKDHCLTVLDYLPAQLHQLLAYRALVSYLDYASSYSIVVGYDDETFYWADIHDNSPKDVMEAHAIVERFA